MKTPNPVKLFARVILSTVSAVLISSAARAAVVNVDIEPFAFNPNNVTINVNDEVQWTWVSDFHNSESSAGVWDSGVFNSGHVFTFTFTNSGNYPYFCVVHGFTGAVNVQNST